MAQERPLPTSIREAMERMPEAFHAERAQGVTAVIQFNFTGAEPGNWTVTIDQGQCRVQEGTADNPQVTIYTPSEVWLKIVRREMDGASAFMSGQLTFSGDLNVLMRLQDWFG